MGLISLGSNCLLFEVINALIERAEFHYWPERGAEPLQPSSCPALTQKTPCHLIRSLDPARQQGHKKKEKETIDSPSF